MFERFRKKPLKTLSPKRKKYFSRETVEDHEKKQTEEAKQRLSREEVEDLAFKQFNIP